ncbi:MAG: pilus assembly protein PilP [Desulfobacterales bacterium]
MTNRTPFIAVILFFLLPLCMGLGKSPEEPEQDIHKSREVKIDRAEEQAEKQDEKVDAKAGQETEDRTGPEAQDSEEPEKAEQKTGKDAASAESGKGQGEVVAEEAEDKELSELMLTEQEALFEDEQRYYTRSGRADPFEPFLRTQEPESEEEEEDEELDRREPQTPLERIALSQLELTAILRIPGKDRAMAMVEDKDGKGYVVRNGTYMGENGGQVEDILKDRIIIKEKYKDVYGKIAEREIEKKLEN